MTRAAAWRAAASVSGLALALWLLPATVQIVDWSPVGTVGPIRLAFLPPLSRLWLAAAVAIGIAIGAALWWRRTGRPLESLAISCLPLALLLLWGVPFMPWLPDRAPLLLLFAGPLRWIVGATAIAGVLRGPIRRAAAAWTPRLTASRAVVLVVSFALYGSLGLRYAGENGFTGDEPHYLIITHSLLHDHDLDIANNHAQRDYRAFFPGDLRPDFLQRGLHEEIYSIHAPGLPALLLPAYAAAGARGAVVFIALLGALAALAVFDLAAAMAGSGIATVVWAAVALTIPFVPHAWLIYPEVAGALIAAWAALWLWQPPPSAGRAALHGLAFALLPWLHTKFALLLALFTLFEMLRLYPRLKTILALLAPIAVSGAAWLYSFYRMYGVFDPEAPYGSYTRMFVLAANIPRGTLGLLVDQKFGLLIYSPAYLLAVGGAWIMLRTPGRRAYAAMMIATALAYFVSTTRLYMWWGGSSAPARFLVPILPLLAPMMAVALTELKSVGGRALTVCAITLSLAIAAAAVASPGEGLLYSPPHGTAALLGALEGSAPLAATIPTFTDENWRTPLAALAPWFLALIVAGAAGIGVRRVRSVFWAAVMPAVAFILTGCVFAGVRSTRDPADVVAAGRLAAMRAYDPGRLHAVDLTRAARISPPEVPAALVLSTRWRADAPPDNPHVLAGPFDLPPGRYEVRLELDASAQAEGEAFVAASDQVLLARTGGPFTTVVRLPFELKVAMPAFVGVTSPALARSVRAIDIAPAALVPAAARVPFSGRTVEPAGGEVPGYIVYAEDGTYPEGGVFWTRGTATATVAIVPEGGAALRLVLHVGPNGGPVAIDAGGRPLTVDLKPDETREVTVPMTPDGQPVVLAIRAARAFRPAAADPKSDDQRDLGCQVRPLLVRP